MIRIKKSSEPLRAPLSHMGLGETFLLEGSLCMIASRNGHHFVLDLITGKDLPIKIQGSMIHVSPVDCELSYTVK